MVPAEKLDVPTYSDKKCWRQSHFRNGLVESEGSDAHIQESNVHLELRA